jgi:hypothetical protein
MSEPGEVTARLQPFGTPEGARADIEELSSNQFINFGGNLATYGALAISPEDMTGRVFVGRKGAGKTVYLRRAQIYARNQKQLFADDIQQELPSTTQIFDINRRFAPSVLTQVWMWMWRVAILRSLYSYLSYEHRLEIPATAEFREGMKSDYGSWLPKQRDPMPVYSQVKAIIRDHRKSSGRTLHDYLAHEDWDAIERRIGRHLADCPPVCFYLDAIDEEFRHAPMHWLMCQKGLFYQVMRFLRGGQLGGRLHIVISIRDLVYSSVMQTEHMTRYIEEKHIRLLEWNMQSISYLLQAKVTQLDSSNYLGDDDAGSPLGMWLGMEKIKNANRRVQEGIEDYLLRHTRLIPRDIVILLNSLHLEASAAKQGGRPLEDEKVREVVSESARLFGVEQVAIAGNQLAISELPEEAVDQDFAEIYTGEHPEGLSKEAGIAPGIEFLEKERRYVYRGLDVYDGNNPILKASAAYQRGIVDRLTELIRKMEVDRFSGRQFKDVIALAEKHFPEARALSVLWQNGLLGYTDGPVDDGAPVFYSATHADPLEIPTDKPGYLLHPCLIDALGVKSRGAPVYPFDVR